MKKIIILSVALLCIGCGVRHNWKVMKNTQLILTGQDINLAKNIYGNPSDSFPAKKNGEKFYLWKVDRTEEVKGIETTSHSNAIAFAWGDTGIASASGNTNSFTQLVKGTWCIIGIKTDSNGKIIKTMYDGYDSDQTKHEPECWRYFSQSKQFCDSVVRNTQKTNHKITFLDCYRDDFSEIIPTPTWNIPQNYEEEHPPIKSKLEEFLE